MSSIDATLKVVVDKAARHGKLRAALWSAVDAMASSDVLMELSERTDITRLGISLQVNEKDVARIGVEITE